MTGSKTGLALLSLAVAVSLAACTGSPAAPSVAPAPDTVAAAPGAEVGGVLTASGGGRGNGPVIYVYSQGLFYDSVVNGPLPPHGKFQLLEMAGPTGLQTEWGPGDKDFRGGRWWVDVDGDGEMDADDNYFSCPLLGPGRENP